MVDKYSNDPAKCWEHFQQLFGGDLLQHQLLLEQKLQHVNMHEGTSLETYINTMNELAGHLASINAEMDKTG